MADPYRLKKKMSQYGLKHMNCQCPYCIGKGNHEQTRRGYKKAARRDGKKDIKKQLSES